MYFGKDVCVPYLSTNKSLQIICDVFVNQTNIQSIADSSSVIQLDFQKLYIGGTYVTDALIAQ